MTRKERMTVIANLVVLKGFVLHEPVMRKLVNESIRILDKERNFKHLYQNFRQN